MTSQSPHVDATDQATLPGATIPAQTTQPSEWTALAAPAARAVEVRKAYGMGDATVVALDHINVDIQAHHYTAIMGPSGSGKSTLLHVMAGLDRPDTGEVFIGETGLGTLNDRALTLLRRDKLGFVFQSFNLLPTMTAAENIALPVRIAGRQPDQAWVDRIVDIVGLSDRLGHRPAELSGGQQQRVAAARALASKPQIVFADEPTGALDSKSGAELLGFLQMAVKELGQTVVMVTHDPVAACYADRVLFLADGQVVDEMDEPTADAVLDYMKHLGD